MYIFGIYVPIPMLVVAIIALIAMAWFLFKGRADEELIGGQPSGRVETEESTDEEVTDEEPVEEEESPYTDSSEYVSLKKGDKIPFDLNHESATAIFTVIGIDDDAEEILGDLTVILPPGATFLDIDRHQEDEVSISQLGFVITMDPPGPAVGNTISYDPNVDEPPSYDDYTLLINEITVEQATPKAS